MRSPKPHGPRRQAHYCTFAQPPRRTAAAYLSPEDVLAIAQAGARAGCREALFTLGDKPELRYGAARDALAKLGYATTLDYLFAMAELVLKETGLLPHLNPGVMSLDDLTRLRKVSVSQGIMLETAAERLAQKGGPHFGSPDKVPAVRLATIAAAGEAKVPFTSGILIGIGETRAERIEALLALRDLHRRHDREVMNIQTPQPSAYAPAKADPVRLASATIQLQGGQTLGVANDLIADGAAINEFLWPQPNTREPADIFHPGPTGGTGPPVRRRF